MLSFLIGFILGVGLVLYILYIIVYDPWGPTSTDLPFIDQFRPIQIPEELRNFLKTGKDGLGISEWESCHSLSLFLHMFYQEHKDTRQLRRWMHKRLQMELNDIATRSAAGRLLKEIRIRDLSLGTKFPCLNSMRVEKVDMSEDKTTFESITFLLNVDYTGGFETSIDVTTMFTANVNLTLKITKLSGLVRLILSRKPFNHWCMSFVTSPVFEPEITSQIQGHQLKRLIPLIKESIRRALQKKHVWPNYKIRYRPVFPNPLLQPSAPLSAFAHVKLEGGLEVTVLKCTRLKVDMLDKDSNWDVFCTLVMDQRPFLQSNAQNVAHSLSVLLMFSRYDLAAPVGITFEKVSPSAAPTVGNRPVKVGTVEPGSLAEKAELKPGDAFVAINNVPIRSERQVTRFLEQTLGDLMILVDRNLDDMDDDEYRDHEEIIGDPTGDPDDAFIALGCVKGGKTPASELNSPEEEGPYTNAPEVYRRHSISVEPKSDPSTSILETESTTSSVPSLINYDDDTYPISASVPAQCFVQRTESARVPQVLVSQASIELRRTRSESQIDIKSSEPSTTVPSRASGEYNEEEEEEECVLQTVRPVDREAPRRELDSLIKKGDDDHLQVDGDPKMTRESSSASLISTNSVRSEVTDDGDDTPCGLSRDRPASRKHRLQATFQAGKRKMMGMMSQKKNSPSSDTIEVGAEAEFFEAEKSDSSSPAHNQSGKRSPFELKVVDKESKKDKKRRRKRHASSGDMIGEKESPTSGPSIKSRITKCTPLRDNLLWGQSLHFTLEAGSQGIPNSCKYLNVTVHAKLNTSSPDASPTEAEPSRPILLGYTSLYIPQLIDDCKLTLSNCHREVFPLKPPVAIDPQQALDSSDFSKHAGYDPRLCFGDITMGFRYFPDGFPEEACLNGGEDMAESKPSEEPSGEDRPMSPPSLKPMNHEWVPWTSKVSTGNICAMCRGKIWMKSGSRCQRCLVVVHSKCTVKANTGIACTPQSSNELDQQFEDLEDEDKDEEVIAAPVNHSMPESTPFRGGDPADGVSRRTKLKNKVSEKFSMWRRNKPKKASDDSDRLSAISQSSNEGGSKGGDESPGSPISSVQDCLSDVLPNLKGSPFISGLFFQPGNAYNEQTINHAKVLGKEIFSEYSGEERMAKINEQIEVLQLAIQETKSGRLEAMNNKNDPAKFENLDERLQALAVVMLHYCAALQDCTNQHKSSTESLVDTDKTEGQPRSSSRQSASLKTSGSSSSSLKSELLENPAELLGSIIEDTISLAEDKSRSVSESTVTGVSSGGS